MLPLLEWKMLEKKKLFIYLSLEAFQIGWMLISCLFRSCEVPLRSHLSLAFWFCSLRFSKCCTNDFQINVLLGNKTMALKGLLDGLKDTNMDLLKTLSEEPGSYLLTLLKAKEFLFRNLKNC